MKDIESLRDELLELDREILACVKRRRDLARNIGARKSALGFPTRDFTQEKVVHQRARALGDELGLSADLTRRLMSLLIQDSLAVQERDRMQEQGVGDGRRALVVGGAGRMGRWMVRFLDSLGFRVEIADPAGGVEGFAHLARWQDSSLDQDIIVVATTLRASRQVLGELAASPPPGLIFDIGSLKSPLREPLLELAGAGARVTSVHPMFGPDTVLLSGRHVIFVDLGVPEATREARRLFDPTMATQVEMDLESHDRLIAQVLGLSHALNIAFLTALSGSGEASDRLSRISSTTFDNQLAVAGGVTRDNPQLYFEIQHLNDFGLDALDGLVAATERVRDTVKSGDEQAFVELMRSGRRYIRQSGEGP